MATPKSITNNYNRRVKEIEESTLLSDEEKESFIFKLNHALDGTNGLEPKDKLQSVSEDVYWLTESSSRSLERYNTICNKLESLERKSDENDEDLMSKLSDIDSKISEGNTLFQFLTASRWALIVGLALICGLLAFRPQLAEVIDSAIKNSKEKSCQV